MNVKELIARLSKLPPETEVMILDSHNGGGYPRELNLGPVLRTIQEDDGVEAADCEDRAGEVVAVVGFGCY